MITSTSVSVTFLLSIIINPSKVIHHVFYYHIVDSFSPNFSKVSLTFRISRNCRRRRTYYKSATTSEIDKPKTKKERKKSIPIIACSSSVELHRAIDMYLKPNDTIVELGAQLSDVSAHICRKIRSSKSNHGGGGHAVLVDIKRDKVSSSRCVGRNIDAFIRNEDYTRHDSDYIHESFLDIVDYFLEIDQLDQWRKIFTMSPINKNSDQSNDFYNFNAMILDIGTMTGNDLSMTALTIAQEFLGYQKHDKNNDIDDENNEARIIPRVVIIKSKTLSTLARRLIHSQRLFDGTVILPSKDDIVMQKKEQKQEHEPYIIASVGVEEYRRTIPFVVDEKDEVVEVGCHFGRTTALLHEKSSFCIGVDIGPKIIKHAKKQYKSVPFAVGDAWKTLDLLKLKQQLIEPSYFPSALTLGYDIIFADIGGLSGTDGLLESIALINSLSCALEPRCIVIKSLCMNRLASQLHAFSNVWNNTRCESSY